MEVLIASGILAILTAGSMSMISYFSKERSRLNATSNLMTARDRIYTLLQNGDAWNESINATPALDCIHQGSTTLCNDGTIATPKVYNQTGTLVYDPAVHGFDLGGNICNLADGAAVCQTKYQLQTKLSCGVPGTCAKPSVVTTGRLIVLSTSLAFPLNEGRYNFEIYHGTRGVASIVSSPGYSKTCSDWMSQGWPDQSSCLQDGRWHLVYETNAVGAVVLGSVNELETHLKNGATFKTVLLLAFGGSEECISAYRSASGVKPIYCLTANRFSGEGPAEIKHGSARYGTDGSIWCNNVDTPGANACGGIDPLPFQWFIRY